MTSRETLKRGQQHRNLAPSLGGPVSQIWVMNAEGSGQHALTTNTAGADTSPAWSPSGKNIVYRSSGNTPSTGDGLYVMNKHGSKPVQLRTATGDGINGWDPIWSPDGKRIAFAARGAYGAWAGDDICLIPATGGANPICPHTSIQVGGDYPTWAAKPPRK